MLSSYTTFLIDLDGVVYRGEELVPGAKEFIAWLETNQKKYLFPTNNSFLSEAQVLAKLARLGIVTQDQHILGAGQAAVRSIVRRFPHASVYVIGEPALKSLVIEHGLTVAPEDNTQADVLLVGLDRAFDYQKLTHAVQVVLSGAAFIAINRDRMLPIAGTMIPGCGALVAAIAAASGTEPEIVGKPEPMLLQEAMRALNSTPAETIMIGDGLETDIRAGKAAGTSTLLVLSGKDSRASLQKSTIQPDYIYESLATVLTALQNEQGGYRHA